MYSLQMRLYILVLQKFQRLIYLFRILSMHVKKRELMLFIPVMASFLKIPILQQLVRKMELPLLAPLHQQLN